MLYQVIDFIVEGPEQARRIIGLKLRDGSRMMLDMARALERFHGARFCHFHQGRLLDISLLHRKTRKR